MTTINDAVYDEFDHDQTRIILKAALVALRSETIKPKLAINLECDEEDLEDLSEQIQDLLDSF